MLPKINTPTFELKQPSTGDTLKYRPFLVGEEKLLLIARESGERKDVYDAVKQIVQNCVLDESFDVNKIPTFDLEYIFIQLRSKSVSNVVEFYITDQAGVQHDLTLDLDTVEVTFPEGHDNKIMIDDTTGLIMKYPTPAISDIIAGMTSGVQVEYTTVKNCIDTVFTEDEVYPWAEASDEEQENFLNVMPTPIYAKIEKFFDTMPQIRHEVEYEDSNGTTQKIIFQDLDDFFQLD